MSHHSTVLMFHVSPPSLLDRLDSTLVPTRSRMGTSRLLASGGFDKGNGHSRSMLTRDLGPYPFKSPQSSVAATYKLYVGGVLDYGVWKVVWSLEKILDHVWSFLYVNQAGGLEGSSDASSVSVKESSSDARFSADLCHQVACHLLLCRRSLGDFVSNAAQTSNQPLRWWFEGMQRFPTL